MKYSFKIASAWGIPIELHITFILLMGAVFVLSYPGLYLFALIMFLFIFVVLHELAHSLVARHYNIRVRKIVLYPIGGVSEIEEIPQNPSIEWRLAIAGPATSFLIGAILLLLNELVVIAEPIREKHGLTLDQPQITPQQSCFFPNPQQHVELGRAQP